MYETCKVVLEYEITEANGKVDLDFIIHFGRVMECGLDPLKCSEADDCRKFFKEKYGTNEESQLSQK